MRNGKETRFWRLAAIVSTFVWLLVFFAANAFPKSGVSKSLFINNIFYAVTILCTLILWLYPTQFYIYTLLCCFWGSFNIYAGSTLNGILMYILGCIFAFRKEFFVKKTLLKVILLLVPLIFAWVSQYRLSKHLVVNSFLNILFLPFLFLVAQTNKGIFLHTI